MNVDGIVDESTGLLENTKVCAYAECIRANSNTEDSTDHCKCQCTRPGLYLPQCSAINDSVQSIIDDVTDNTNQEFCALSDASTRHDSLYSTLVYNKAFVAMADLQTSTVTDANGKEHVYIRGQTKSVADHALHDNMLYISANQGITDTLVHTFVTLMTS
ncbi:hypothetical protein O3M35_013326 [Rhynocoris fuscipes]|uniref:Uncharacterized protein n=1 Tax=Rhynocoris fuscipes TaxID=488301 RepID=A0AAW1CGL2_9HEMI